MSINEKAIQREKDEPTELDQRIPSLFLVFIGLMGGWGSSYFYYNADNSHGRGDTRSQNTVSMESTKATSTLDGKALYNARCSACHQSTGMGLAGAFPPLKDSEWITGKSELPIEIVLRGLQGEIEVKGQSFNGVMPSFADQLQDDEIGAILSYVRSEFGGLSTNTVDAETIASLRKTVDPTPIQGETELLRIRDGSLPAAKEDVLSVTPTEEEPKDTLEKTEVEEANIENSPPSEEPTVENMHQNGALVYQKICSSCHQPTGAGIPGAFPPLQGSEWINRDPALIATIIQRGLSGEIEVAGSKYVSAMPSFGTALSAEEMRDVTTYVQRQFGEFKTALSLQRINDIRTQGGGAINGQAELSSLFPQ